MNGVHDMGGQHGFGPVAPEADEPLFHAPWEARVLALTLAVGFLGRWTLDASRHARERIEGSRYLGLSYYERWLEGLQTLIAERGLLTTSGLAPVAPAAALERLARGGPADRPATTAPLFAVGEAVRARNLNPPGHIRLPRYLKGRTGRITRLHGVHVLPDASAHDAGEAPEPLYQVRFEAEALWGPQADAASAVHADLWESYLEHA